MRIYNQLTYKGIKFGTNKVKGRQNTIDGWGCKLCSFATIAGIDPVELDRIFCEKGGVYFGADGNMIDDAGAARALGWQFLGRETDINKAPDWEPTIKEVDFSIKDGKQQHFVVRMKESILDPYEGVERSKDFYEKKSGKFCSYRLFKAPGTAPAPVPTPPTDPCADLRAENVMLREKIGQAVAVLQS